MQTPETQQAYAQGYHVGYQHGVESCGGGRSGYPIDLIARRPTRSSRLLMLFMFIKPLLLLPHIIVLWFLSIGAGVVMILAWFAVLFTGTYPQALWDFMVGFQRWTTRVQAWLHGLTDQYPPFSLS